MVLAIFIVYIQCMYLVNSVSFGCVFSVYKLLMDSIKLTWFFNELRRTIFHYGYFNVFLIIKCAGYVKLMGGAGLIGQAGLRMSSYSPGARGRKLR